MKPQYALLVIATVTFAVGRPSFAQDNPIVPDLSRITRADGWTILNRHISTVNHEKKVCAQLDVQQGDGIVWLEDCDFDTGILEADLQGVNVQGGSFVGIAFRGRDKDTYDAVYFRAFNFASEDSIRRRHAVQYISHPAFTWEKLREAQPGKFENAINPIPDPGSFFHVKIVVARPVISVFVNGAAQPCLVVNELSNRKGGWVGLWVGNYSGGTFANLKIFKTHR